MKKLKKTAVTIIMTKSTHACQQKSNPSRDSVPLMQNGCTTYFHFVLQ
jgi:hypothetical protein